MEAEGLQAPGQSAMVSSVTSGTYTGVGNRALTFKGAPKSVLALTDASTTILDAQLADRGVVFNKNETYFSYLSGWSLPLQSRQRMQDHSK